MTIEELEELKEHAAEFVAQFTWGNVAANTKKCQKVFKELYYTIFNIIPLCSGCAKSVAYYDDMVEFSKDINYLNKKTNHMSRFKMFADQVPWVAEVKNYVTNASLTDELALQMLAASKQHKQYFEVLPDGWEEEVEQYKLDSGKAAAEAAAKAEEEAKLKAEEQARIETEAAEKEAREAEAARLKAEEEAALKAEQDEAEKKAAAEAAAKAKADGKSKGNSGK